ncbi:MAG: hypothetical protein HYR91_11450 [Flavobacteriia bacterium]|nr:hypothetical protein [Flavobacteriia bacterium]
MHTTTIMPFKEKISNFFNLKINVSIIILFLLKNITMACTGGTSNGTLSPSVSYQTQNVLNGQYYTFNVSSCSSYTFTFCSNGGSASYDTQLSILDGTGATELAYSDDNCGLQSSITWTATYTGTARILISKYNCDHDLSSSATLAYNYTPKLGSYCLTDNASYITVSGATCVQLTPEVNNQKGCAWNDTQVNFNTDFSVGMNFYFGNNINGADGSTIVFQPNGTNICGTAGGELGTGGLSNALVVEFDTYDNDNPTHAVDIAADHIAIDTDGSLQNSTHKAGPIAAIAGGSNIDDGNMHHVEIDWIDASNTLKVYFDAVLRLSVSEDFVTTLFGGDNTVNWGATASTGGLNNQQYFCPDIPIVLPIELVQFDSKCENNQSTINWTTATENNLDYFVLEKTLDGQVYTTEKIIQTSGNSKSIMNYSVTINDNKMYYYRLKMVDNDGNIKNSDLIINERCKNNSENILENYIFSNNKLNLSLNSKNIKCQLISMTGQIIIDFDKIPQYEESFIIPEITQGMYLLQLIDEENSIQEVKRIFHTIN